MTRKATLNDVEAITNIYNYYVENKMPTFDENPVTENFFKKKISTHSDKFPWLVYELNNTVIGYAYTSPWKSRFGYRFTAEISIYLHPNNTEKGIGSLLYKELIKLLKEKGFNSIIGGITLPNPPCVKLHEKFGFKKVTQFKQVGIKFNKWADVGYWQLLLNK